MCKMTDTRLLASVYILLSGTYWQILTMLGMPQPAYNNLCELQVESDEARRHLYFHWSVNISGKPYLQRPLFQTNI
jgi:tRNA(His) 5'-end guanylyltransferase